MLGALRRYCPFVGPCVPPISGLPRAFWGPVFGSITPVNLRTDANLPTSVRRIGPIRRALPPHVEESLSRWGLCRVGGHGGDHPRDYGVNCGVNRLLSVAVTWFLHVWGSSERRFDTAPPLATR